MNKYLLIGLLAVVAVGCAQAEMVRIMANEDGAMVAVDPFELWAKARTSLNAKKTVYEEYFIEEHQAGAQYADASEGAQDAPIKVEHEVVKDLSIPEAVGKSISENPWSWTLGAAGLAIGTYFIGDSAGWWGKDSGDDGATRPQIAVQSGDMSPVTIIIGDNNAPGSGTKVDETKTTLAAP